MQILLGDKKASSFCSKKKSTLTEIIIDNLPALCREFSRDPTLEFVVQSSFLLSIYRGNNLVQKFLSQKIKTHLIDSTISKDMFKHFNLNLNIKAVFFVHNIKAEYWLFTFSYLQFKNRIYQAANHLFELQHIKKVSNQISQFIFGHLLLN